MDWQQEVAWCRWLWDSLVDGGIWGVPRSGLLFKKDESSRTLILCDRMPHDPLMLPISDEELRQQQDADFEAIKRRFEAAGITVMDESAS